MIMYVDQKYYIRSEHMTGLFFGVRVERRRVFYDGVRPRYVTRKGPRRVGLLNQWSGTQGMLQYPVYLNAWTGPPLSA